MNNDVSKNIYNNIHNLYNMDFKTWQEVLSNLYNLVADTTQKFELFEQKFEYNLGVEVTQVIKKMYENGTLAEIINSEVFKLLNDKINNNVNSISSITDTLNIVESQLIKKASLQELITERNRIDNLIQLSSGEVDNTEMNDARISIDGHHHSTVGEAIRSQNRNLKNKIDNIIGYNPTYPIKWVDGGYIDNNNGSLVADSNWKYTNFIEIGNGVKELLCDTSLTGSYSYNGFYDINEKFISKFSVNVRKIKIPSNAHSFRLSCSKSANTIIERNVETLNEKCNVNKVNAISSALDDKLINDYMGVKVEYNPIWIDGGYISNVDGSIVNYNNWKYTDLIEIDESVKQLLIETSLTGSFSYNAFYDEKEKFIKSLNVKETIVDKPSNAKFVRLSVNNGSYTKIKNKIDKLSDKCTLKDVEKILGGSGQTDILSLNKDVEPFIIQASEGLGQRFTDKTKPLTFTHFSDVHTRQELWDRIIQFNNYYANYLKFSIHTGDYCGGSQQSHIDLYKNGQSCKIPVYNCVGNHDTFIDNKGTKGSKEKTKKLLFNHTSGWGVTFMDLENSMTYYKDFSNEKIRFIVLDYYYDIDEQCTWLLERLNGAKALGYHVVTCMHEMTNVITNKLNTPFQTIDNFEALGGNKWSISKFDKVIGDWKKSGGIHVCNFAGHEHSDFIGYTDNDVLNVCVQSATDDIIWTDGKRVQGTRTWDCFNVVSVEVATNTLKIVRVGNNSDHYLREKRLLTFNYATKKIITT